MDPIYQKVNLTTANILFEYDYVIKNPDVFILKKIVSTYYDKFKEYLDLSTISTLSDQALMKLIIMREEPNLLKWTSIKEFDYDKNYEFLHNAWKIMYRDSSPLYGAKIINNFLTSYCIGDIYVWNPVDDIRQRFDLLELFGESKIQYVTGTMEAVLKQIKPNIVYDSNAERVAKLNELDEFDTIYFGIGAYRYNFNEDGSLKFNLDNRDNIGTFPIITTDGVSDFKG